MSAETVETEPDPYTCECGAALWCASMRHTLMDCEADCQYWAEDPNDQSAWCCVDSPGNECDAGKACTNLCACKEDDA